MRISKHGRSAHGDSDLGRGQAFQLQIHSPARTPTHSLRSIQPANPPTKQSSLWSTRYTARTGETITV